MIKHAVILAGSKGTRLRPYTITIPKPIVPIVDKTILEIMILRLAQHSFKKITLAVNHLAELIEAIFENGSKWGVDIQYSLDHKPLSMIGPLKLIKNLPENFLVLNDDTLTDLDFNEFFEFHVKNNNILTDSAYEREIDTNYGVLTIDENCKLVDFKEKPKIKYLVSMGIYAANKKILDYIPDDQPYGFDNLMLDLIKHGNPAAIKKFDGIWFDIGRPDDYEEASIFFEKHRNIFLAP
ncbi:MAG: sugar phosphate nucleotidyltransferase [Promethearchaeota archaeon]